LITLQADIPSPFISKPAAPGEKIDKNEDAEESTIRVVLSKNTGGNRVIDKTGSKKNHPPSTAEKSESDDPDSPPQIIRIDLEDITDRVLAFPVPAGRYGQIRGLHGKVIFSSYPIEGTLSKYLHHNVPLAKGYLDVYDFEEQEIDTLIQGITSFKLSSDTKTLIYQVDNRLRMLKAGSKPDEYNMIPNRKSGWLDLNRIRLSIQPQAEWEQMYREAWRLQRDYFWTENMLGIDWQAIYQRYFPLVKRVATRAEFSDLMWEMQGELGTSHAYEFGGDYRPSPGYYQGFLGVDFRYDQETDSYYVEHVLRGDVWDENASSPLSQPGMKIKVDDMLLAVNGQPVGQGVSPQQLLVNQIFNDIYLTFERIIDPDDEVEETVEQSSDCLPSSDDATEETVEQSQSENCATDETPEKTRKYIVPIKTMVDESMARYREWVEMNRQQVHEATDGRVGYVHIPDMEARGYAEFHRGYLAEISREGLIVDVRFNRGGHVSQLILEKLARRRLGYDVQRWGEPVPYPEESVLGPIVAICNEQTGSDGDVFCHAFKLMNLGVLIGKRTWGGVIGISINEVLVDGGITTQPEFSQWFKDVGWAIENYGTAPDIEVEISPQDYATGQDPQLERAIQEIQKTMAENPSSLPEFGNRPTLALPKLPRNHK
jgi:tricorn protease